METLGDKPLFELTVSAFEKVLSSQFQAFNATHPIRCEVGAALMLADIAAQRLALKMGMAGYAYDAGSEELGSLLEAVEMLHGFLLEGRPSRIDLVLWDAVGYIHGWFLNESGRLDTTFGSCPEVVATLAAVLQALVSYERDWQVLLERYAVSLTALIQLAREKAEVQARGKLESQNWLKRLFFRASLERELLTLGFR